ncbi:MAG: carboxylesterase family protein [Phycisphaerales bacterium]
MRRRSELRQRFGRLDRDGDGMLSREDVADARWLRAALRRFDENGDDQLSREELGGSAAGDAPAAMPAMPSVRRHADVAYAAHHPQQRLDIYVPRPDPVRDRNAHAHVVAGSDRPVVIMIHGGGWRSGDKANAAVVGAKMRHFVARGSVYVSVNYRLSPDASPGSTEVEAVRHPTHVADCAAAIGWIHRNIARYGGDPEQLHLLGHSSGAHLAALVTADPQWLHAEAVPRAVVRTTVLLDTAALDVSAQIARSPASRGLYVNAFGHDQSEWRAASPLTQLVENATPDHPRTLLLVNGRRRDAMADAVRMATILNAAGALSTVMDTGLRTHAEINVLLGTASDPMMAYVDRLHAGDDPRSFPATVDPARPQAPAHVAVPASDPDADLDPDAAPHPDADSNPGPLTPSR